MSVFENNINALALKDKELASKIAAHIVSDVPQLVCENGFYNIIYKNIYLHNRENPLGEAKEIFMRAENTPVTIHLIYGLGLGYLFQVAAANSKGTVILYEPDLNLLKIVFNLVDFSKDILKNNVFIANTLDKAGEYIYQKSNTKNTPLMLTTNSYMDLNGAGFNELVEKLRRMVGSYTLDLKYTKKKFFPQLSMMINNIPSLIKETPLIAVKDFYKGKTAVVVSAGPTLDKNIDTLKRYRDNYVLFVVGTAMKTLAKHGIKPDFLCIIESYDSTKQIEGLDLSEVNFITEPYSHPNLRKFQFRKVFSHISANMPINFLWSDMCGENIEEYWSKGTVSYTAINAARILGCSKIVLVGQDLAYIEGQCYSKDSAYKDLVCSYNKELGKWEIAAKDFEKFAASLSNSPDAETRKRVATNRLVNLNKSLYYVKGIKGDMIPTESVYAAFIKPLTEFTEKFNDRIYINTSLVGAQIDGFANMSLEDALKDPKPVGDRNIGVDYKYDTEKIVNKLQGALDEFKQIAAKLESGKGILKNLKNEFERHKAVSVDVLKCLKKLSVNYYDLSTNYKNTFFDFIIAAERIDLDYEMKMTKEFTQETVSNYIAKMTNFYEQAEKKMKLTEQRITNVIKEIE